MRKYNVSAIVPGKRYEFTLGLYAPDEKQAIRMAKQFDPDVFLRAKKIKVEAQNDETTAE